MQHRQLPGIDRHASALGFGCAALMGRVNRRNSLRALETAYDAGINYFDAARSYGYGEAEAVLGAFLKGRREQVIVATKFGIMPARRKSLLRRTLPIAGKLTALLPRRGRELAKKAAVRSSLAKTSQGHFDVDTARRSLDQSLRLLGTDYVDVLLLHGCTYTDAADEELLQFLDECIRAGKARSIGVATNVRECKAICEHLASFQVAQFTTNLLDDGVNQFREADRVATVTHSPFGRGINLIRCVVDYARQHHDATRTVQEVAGYDLRTPEGAARLLLQYALIQNGQGVVLCGMSKPPHIAANVNTVQQALPHEELGRAIRELRNGIKQQVQRAA